MHAYIHTYRHTHTFSEHFWQTNSCTFQSSSSEAPPLVPMAWRQFGELSYGVEGSEKRPSRSDKICAALPDAEMIETQQSLVLGSIYIYTCVYVYIYSTHTICLYDVHVDRKVMYHYTSFTLDMWLLMQSHVAFRQQQSWQARPAGTASWQQQLLGIEGTADGIGRGIGLMNRFI